MEQEGGAVISVTAACSKQRARKRGRRRKRRRGTDTLPPDESQRGSHALANTLVFTLMFLSGLKPIIWILPLMASWRTTSSSSTVRMFSHKGIIISPWCLSDHTFLAIMTINKRKSLVLTQWHMHSRDVWGCSRMCLLTTGCLNFDLSWWWSLHNIRSTAFLKNIYQVIMRENSNFSIRNEALRQRMLQSAEFRLRS